MSYSSNYVVRIYRSEKGNPRLLVGVVEEVGVKGKRAFQTYDDLWEILNPRTHEVRFLEKSGREKAKGVHQ
jgi:hypothetical protein